MEVLTLDDLNQRERLRLLQRKAELLSTQGVSFYTPHVKQHQFHCAGGQKFRYYRAGNRSGKSECGTAEDVAWALGERPWMLRDYPLLNGKGEVVGHHKASQTAARLGIPQGPNKVRVVTTDWKKAKDVLTGDRFKRGGKLFHWLPKDSYEDAGIRVNSEGTISTIYLKNGSVIEIGTIKAFSQNELGAESSNYSCVHYDEPPPRDLFRADLRGLTDSDGSVWFTLTPLTEPWINDVFIPNRASLIVLESDAALFNGRKWMTTGSIFDNPYLKPEAIEAFRAELTKEQEQCRLYGVPMSSSGLVYSEFKYEKHVLQQPPTGWDDFDNPSKDCCIYVAIDPHPQTPHAVLFCAVTPPPYTQKIFYDEISEAVYMDSLAWSLNERLQNRWNPTILLDPLAYITDKITGDCMADALMREGIICQKAVKDLTHGIPATKTALRKDNNYYFSPRLTQTMYEFDHYMWNPDHPNKPIDKDDHMMENLYRMTLNGLDYISPPDDAPIRQHSLDMSNPSLDLPNLSLGDLLN